MQAASAKPLKTVSTSCRRSSATAGEVAPSTKSRVVCTAACGRGSQQNTQEVPVSKPADKTRSCGLCDGRGGGSSGCARGVCVLLVHRAVCVSSDSRILRICDSGGSEGRATSSSSMGSVIGDTQLHVLATVLLLDRGKDRSGSGFISFHHAVNLRDQHVKSSNGDSFFSDFRVAILRCALPLSRCQDDGPPYRDAFTSHHLTSTGLIGSRQRVVPLEHICGQPGHHQPCISVRSRRTHLV